MTPSVIHPLMKGAAAFTVLHISDDFIPQNADQ